ncbi:MAG: DUF2961 domain-containing protein, partial [Phycisphaerales bacterium]
MKKQVVVAALTVIAFVCHAQAQSVGLAFYEDLSSLPVLYPNVQSHYLSSYDRTGGNDDGFRGTYSQLYIDERGEHVIFDANGPGCVYNLWFTGSRRHLHWGKLRFYFDEETTPRFVCEAREFFAGQCSPFVYPLVTHAFISSGGFSCSAPLPFAKRLKITTEKTAGFYNIYYQLYERVSLTSWTPQFDYTHLIDRFQRCGSDPKPVTERIEVASKAVGLSAASGRKRPEQELLKVDGPATIQYLKINPLYHPNTYSLNHMHLRIFYDGQVTPSVDVPLGPFFGSGLGEADVRGLFVGMSSSGTYYCYWPMPFRRAIRITLQNHSFEAGGEFFVEIGYTNALPKTEGPAPIGYFGARYNRAWPIVEPEDYILFDYEGRGAVVGQVMTVEPVKLDRKRW